MTMEMPESLRQKRDELVGVCYDSYFNGVEIKGRAPQCVRDGYKIGFDQCWEHVSKIIERMRDQRDRAMECLHTVKEHERTKESCVTYIKDALKEIDEMVSGESLPVAQEPGEKD